MPTNPQDAWNQVNKIQTVLLQAMQAYGRDGQPSHLKMVVENQQQIIAILIGLLRSPAGPAEAAAMKAQEMRLQQELQKMASLTTAISNMMKARHDTAKNAIANMR